MLLVAGAPAGCSSGAGMHQELVQLVCSRRLFLATSAGIFAAFAPSRAALAEAHPLPSRLGDAHVHLFNLSDLPARGFVKHVFVGPESAGNGILPAILNLIDELRRQVMTATDELEQYRGAQHQPQLLPARRIYLHARQHMQAKAEGGLSDPGLRGLIRLLKAPLGVTDSYSLLNILSNRIDRVARRFGSSLEELLGVPPRDDIADFLSGGATKPINSKRVDKLLRRFAKPKPPECPQGSTSSDEMSLEWIRAQLRWVHLMLQPRQFHLNRYLAHIQSQELRPRLIVNLLVDYDKWLNDQPHPASCHGQQVRFWSRISPDYRDQVDIRTFAGFDPLKHAEQRATHETTHLDDLLSYYRARTDPKSKHVIHGFKLYPPMGFAPYGNTKEMFDSSKAPVDAIRRRWDDEPRLRDRQIHVELNEALADFFARCSAERIPILAHARHSNEAGQCFGARAAPLGWEQVARANPGLRLCLGHFAEAHDFAEGMKNWDHPELVPPNSWAILGTGRLLALNEVIGAKVFADIGYMSEFLLAREDRGRRRAKLFFENLKKYCIRFDPGCRYLMFGSDWIMLGREPRHELYVDAVKRGMDEAGWSAEWQENLLYNNLRRFLDA